MLRLDDIDRTIIAYLEADGRASFAAAGEHVGLSASAIKRRVDRLRGGGVITGFVAVVDPAAAGMPVIEAFVELTCRDRTSPSDLRAIARRLPEVVAAYTVTGVADALFQVRTAGIGELERVLERIRSDPNVERTASTLVLSSLIDSHTPPSMPGLADAPTSGR